jgi:hypothetical protein
MFPIAPYVLSHMVWPWFNFHLYNVVKRGLGGGRKHKIGFYVGECPMLQNYW